MDRRSDLRQISVALLMTREGIPVRYLGFAGTAADAAACSSVPAWDSSSSAQPSIPWGMPNRSRTLSWPNAEATGSASPEFVDNALNLLRQVGIIEPVREMDRNCTFLSRDHRGIGVFALGL